ncbi:DUF1285 domain-containing protein [Amphritea opalescens]|uniref:DUF1285 domain-containing protein n=1 Tax=Amphritea opalescens TaxID=2490544 RepID=A0A430KRY5_9GAMM|nr:DUF1285 domain-containing protein [Amphritea opalescens]RTE66271.1 DUF1285 domain-containing protein [Amphritea opalescens]
MSEKKLDLASLQQQLGNEPQEKRSLPPVHLWKPEFSGDLDIQITRDGRWIHEGGEIKRPAMVKLFSTILWREGDRYFLVTPVEKVGIQVEDVPFFFTRLDVRQGPQGQELVFTSSTDDEVIASAEHPLRVETVPGTDDEPAPYLMVRYGMEGRLNRNVFYQLADLAEEHNGVFAVQSCGQWFVLE